MLQHQRLRIQEASVMLQHILGARTKYLTAQHVATGEVMYTQGLLLLYLGDPTRAKTLVRQALDVYVEILGQEHPSTVDVNNVLLQLQDAGV
ncbi:hypothetical protein PINS_up004426 [Pythium insidiosum]|nr:hypothetical protein PINS_up004426 [Pythium insidiosum]